VEAFAAGRSSAYAIDAFLKNKPLPTDLPPLRSRTTGLIVNLDGIEAAPRVAMPDLPYQDRLAAPEAEVELGLSREVARTEAERCLTCVCSECVKNCTFLQAYVGHFPYTEKEIVSVLQEVGELKPKIPYSCHYCGLCQAVCPKELHAGEVCLDFRRRLVAGGKGPLPEHRSIQNYVKWGTHALFTLTQPDPVSGKAERVFFPGCSLPGYSPHLVRAAYDYLKQRLPHTGLMLNCCGAPSRLIGEEALFQGIVANVAKEMAKLGASEMIVACTHCLESFRENLPELKCRTMYEILLETGLPDQTRTTPSLRFHIHDACGARLTPVVHEAVRQMVTGLGHRYEEMPHHKERSICCGAGGMAPAVDAALAQTMTDFRLSEARHDLITYCATCRAVFAQARHPALHVLDLIFNPAWPKARLTRPANSLRRWWQRWRLKRSLQS
jgi:Fe-S oxidoreductase